MLWNQCVPPAFYSFVKQPENFEYLLSQNVSFRGVNEIVMKFVALEFQNGHDLVSYFINYYSNYQYIYSMLFPKYYNQNNKHGMRNTIKFALCYGNWLATKKNDQIGKNFLILISLTILKLFRGINTSKNQSKLIMTTFLGLIFLTLDNRSEPQLKKLMLQTVAKRKYSSSTTKYHDLSAGISRDL